MRIRSNDGDLSARPIENPFANRVALCSISVEQTIGSAASDHSGELPTQIHRIARSTEINRNKARNQVRINRRRAAISKQLTL